MNLVIPASLLSGHDTSYQPCPLASYSRSLQAVARDLFARACRYVEPCRAVAHEGSFSILSASTKVTAAKIVIYEAGRGKINGRDPCLADGVYVLIRTKPTENNGAFTIAVAPRPVRFAYFRLSGGQDLDEVARFMVACADRF